MKPLGGALNVSKRFLEPVEYAMDATCGNGHDTLLLSQLARKVWAFDIQSAAIDATRQRLAGAANVVLIQDSFVNFKRYIDHPLDLVVFNLGYLPGSDKTITTQRSDLAEILQDLLASLSDQGRIVIVAYPGHPAGQAESEYLLERLPELDSMHFRSFSFRHMNGPNQPPELYIIERNAR